MAKHLIVFVSKDTTFRLPKQATDGITARNADIRFKYFENNAEPLAKVYNSVLNDASSTEFDYITLMHADVGLNLDEFVSHAESVSGKYDVIGLCGCSKISVGESPLNWYCGSQQFTTDRWGCVTHGEIGNQTSWFSQHHPEVTDHQVACIDGLSITFTRKAVASGLRFDESLGAFDLYDTDISMQAIIKYGLKVGVIVRKDLVHYSVGKSIMTDGFLLNEKKFRAKWNFEAKPGSKILSM